VEQDELIRRARREGCLHNIRAFAAFLDEYLKHAAPIFRAASRNEVSDWTIRKAQSAASEDRNGRC
jgi:hypothetical protein